MPSSPLGYAITPSEKAILPFAVLFIPILMLFTASYLLKPCFIWRYLFFSVTLALPLFLSAVMDLWPHIMKLGILGLLIAFMSCQWASIERPFRMDWQRVKPILQTLVQRGEMGAIIQRGNNSVLDEIQYYVNIHDDSFDEYIGSDEFFYQSFWTVKQTETLLGSLRGTQGRRFEPHMGICGKEQVSRPRLEFWRQPALISLPFHSSMYSDFSLKYCVQYNKADYEGASLTV